MNEDSVAGIAERVGYSSASTFSIAFTRHVGLAPSRYAREHADAPVPSLEPVQKNQLATLSSAGAAAAKAL